MSISPEHWGEGSDAVGNESIAEEAAGATRPELQESIRQNTEASRSVKSEAQKYCVESPLPFINVYWVGIELFPSHQSLSFININANGLTFK